MDEYLDQLTKEILDHVAKYECVVIYSDFRFLIERPDIAMKRNDFMLGLYQRMQDSGKTFFTPSYTYTNEGRFDVEKTPTKVSALSRWLVSQNMTTRSEHPIFSYIAFGPKTSLALNIGKSAFGEDSLYDRLRSENAGFLHLGRPVSLGNTMVHHIEHMCGATYRFHKTFRTEVFKNGEFLGSDYTAFVRRRDIEGETFAFRFDQAATMLEQSGMVQQHDQKGEMPYLASYPLDAARKLMVELFKSNPTAFVNSKFQQY